MAKAWTPLILLTLAAGAWAQDGGKLAWRGKDESPKNAIADARAQGRPALLFFTSLGCKYCKEISQGAFSDQAVIDATSGLTCIFIDCDWGKKNEDLAEQFRVTGYPTIVFCDPAGKDVGRLHGRKTAEILKEINDIVRKYPAGASPAARPSYQEYSPDLLPGARKARKPLLIFFYDESQASDAVNRSLSDPLLADLRRGLILTQAAYRKGSDLCTRCDVTRAPTLLLLDPALEKPEEKPKARIAGSRSPRELSRDLEAALAGNPPSPARADPSALPIPAPQESLSDDEVDRRFIQSRLSVAIESDKKGKKEKAIEILEDIIQTFPRHVLTQDAKILLEQLKK